MREKNKKDLKRAGQNGDGRGERGKSPGRYDLSPRSLKTFKYTTCGGFSYQGVEQLRSGIDPETAILAISCAAESYVTT